MRQPLWERIKMKWCEWFGHKPYDTWEYPEGVKHHTCSRCNIVYMEG